MNITSSQLRATPTANSRANRDLVPENKAPSESVTFGGYQEYPPVWFGGAMPAFGAIMNGLGAADADPHGRTDLVHKSLGGVASNLAGTGLLVAAVCKGSFTMGALGVGLLGVSGFVAGHVFQNMP